MNWDLPTGSLLVARGGEVIAEWTCGWADRESREPCTARTRFQIASLSKGFTAAAVLKLAGEQRLDLTDRLASWFPSAPRSWNDITVHCLLSHTSGLGHWSDYPEIDLFERPREDVVTAFGRRPPLSAPGARFSYSSPGYVLLARIVELTSGAPYAEHLRTAIFAPAGMSSTFAGEEQGEPNLARPYRAGSRTRSFELASLGMGTGDVWSTPGDLMRWYDALQNDSVVPAPMRELMFTPHAATGPAEGPGYGYGWVLGPLGGEEARCHTGDNGDYRALHAWWPADDTRFVVLTNSGDVSHEQLRGLAEKARTLLGRGLG